MISRLKSLDRKDLIILSMVLYEVARELVSYGYKIEFPHRIDTAITGAVPVIWAVFKGEAV